MTTFNYGCLVDGPGNDLKYSASPLISTPMSDNPSVKQYFRQINNQGQIQDCVANGTADAFEMQLARRDNVAPDQLGELSRLFIYWNARNLDTPPCSDVDAGSKIRFAFDCMARYGVPFETLWTYDVLNVNVRPSIIAYREAIKNRINKFYRIDGIGQDRIGQIKQALCSTNPVVFGTKIAKISMDITDDTVVKDPKGNYIGRHCLVIVSHSEVKKAFEIRNSWGLEWADNGYCWMDEDYLGNPDTTEDIWVPTL